jgi:hypothetical protein
VKRAELELAIVTAARLIQHDEVLIIGSQAILGSFDETVLPPTATMSQEVDWAGVPGYGLPCPLDLYMSSSFCLCVACQIGDLVS